jgi:hypothetical protein
MRRTTNQTHADWSTSKDYAATIQVGSTVENGSAVWAQQVSPDCSLAACFGSLLGDPVVVMGHIYKRRSPMALGPRYMAMWRERYVRRSSSSRLFTGTRQSIHPSFLRRTQCSLDTVTHIQLPEDLLDVGFHGVLA